MKEPASSEMYTSYLVDAAIEDNIASVDESSGVVADCVNLSSWQYTSCQKCHKTFENEKDVYDHMARRHPKETFPDKSRNKESSFEISKDDSVIYKGTLLSERLSDIIKIKEKLDNHDLSNHERAVELLKLKTMQLTYVEITENELEDAVREISNEGGSHGSMASLVLFEWKQGVLKPKIETADVEKNKEIVSPKKSKDDSVFITPPPATPTRFKCKQCIFESDSLLKLVDHGKVHKEKPRKRKKEDWLDDSPPRKAQMKLTATPSSPCMVLKKRRFLLTAINVKQVMPERMVSKDIMTKFIEHMMH